MTDGAGALAWTEAGDPTSPPLLMIHALGADRRMWEPQIPELSRVRRVLLVDLPGHGTSIASPGPLTVSRLGDELIGVVDEAGADSFELCGMSLGGLISLWMAARVPDRVTALVASNTAARIGSEELWQARIDAVKEGGLEAISEQALGRFFTAAFAVHHPEVYRSTKETLLGTNPAAYIACCAALRDADLRELVEAIQCPTLVIGGGEDISTPPEQAEWLSEHIAGSRLVILEGAPHFANLERPEEWTSIVAEFLAERS
ncbi:MAG TPA: 3-oxoadipate enol-lactonase [Acidimicrobiia bacterium]|nr:3-oxoadipate enol-lactonase [Acidimicrobiia bacterium]